MLFRSASLASASVTEASVSESESASAIGSESTSVSDVESEFSVVLALVMEDWVLVLNSVNGVDGEVLLLGVDVNGWVLNNEWNFLGYGVLFEFVNS